MLPNKMEHCIVFMNSWDVSGAFWSFSKCNFIIPHFPTDPPLAIAPTARAGQPPQPRAGARRGRRGVVSGGHVFDFISIWPDRFGTVVGTRTVISIVQCQYTMYPARRPPRAARSAVPYTAYSALKPQPLTLVALSNCNSHLE